MKRWLFFGYGLASYGLFFALYAYMAGFVGGFAGAEDDRHAERRAVGGGARGESAAIGGVWAAAFGDGSAGVQAGLDADCAAADRAEHLRVCVDSGAGAVDVGLAGDRRGGVGRRATGAAWRGVGIVRGRAGWLVPAVSLLINHFDLFGMRQVWLHLRGADYTSLPFRTPLAYKHVRHPLYLGWAIAFWATPTMTVGHLLFAAVLTGYMMVAAVYRRARPGGPLRPQYADYRRARADVRAAAGRARACGRMRRSWPRRSPWRDRSPLSLDFVDVFVGDVAGVEFVELGRLRQVDHDRVALVVGERGVLEFAGEHVAADFVVVAQEVPVVAGDVERAHPLRAAEADERAAQVVVLPGDLVLDDFDQRLERAATGRGRCGG